MVGSRILEEENWKKQDYVFNFGFGCLFETFEMSWNMKKEKSNLYMRFIHSQHGYRLSTKGLKKWITLEKIIRAIFNSHQLRTVRAGSLKSIIKARLRTEPRNVRV